MMKKYLIFIFLSIFAAVRFIYPHVVLANCDTTRCDCTEHPQVSTPCSPSYCETKPSQTGNSGGVSVTVYYCGTAKAAGAPSPSTKILSPSGWLSGGINPIDPGFGATVANLGANFGLNFFTNNVATFVISAALFILFTASLIFLLIGGIMWITSGGNKEGAAKAKNTVTYAIIGLALGIASFIFINILGTFFGINLSGGPKPLSSKEIQDCLNLGIKLVDCQQLYH